MKTLRHFLLAIAFCIFAAGSVYSATPNRTRIRYVDRINATSTAFSNQGIQAKADRVSSSRGNLVLIYDESLPDSIKTALDVAKDIWESRVPHKQPVYISIVFEPNDFDAAMYAEVIYLEDGTGYPSSLISQLNDDASGSSIDYPDGFIIFNSDIDWNCAFSSNLNTGYNITTMVLRGIALCYGFGASIRQRDTRFEYQNYNPNAFDQLLKRKTTGKYLTSLTEGGNEFNAFVTSDDVCAVTSNATYDVYAPKTYEPYRSLVYLKNDNSLMSYSLAIGNSSLQIDNATINILNEIGWQIPKTGFDIVCSDMSSNGIGSSYQQHTFLLDCGTAQVSDYKWTFKLKKMSGEYAIVSTGSGRNFTIAKITDHTGYYVNRNGDLEGRIECSYTLNGKTLAANPFALSLELKPAILSIEKRIVENESDYSYYALMNISYTGADYVTVEVEEDYDPSVRSYMIFEPFIAHLKTGYVSTLYDSWITVFVKNQYGTASETIYVPSAYQDYNFSADRLSGITSVTSQQNSYRLEVYSIDGQLIYTGSNENFSTANIPSGLYIKKLYDESSRHVKTSKFYVK